MQSAVGYISVEDATQIDCVRYLHMRLEHDYAVHRVCNIQLARSNTPYGSMYLYSGTP